MMKNKIYNFVHLTSYLTIIHGCLYAIIKYNLQIESEYGFRPHQYQALIQAIHIVLSPLLIFSFGLLWQDHIFPKLKKFKQKKVTGLSLVILIILMSLTGYLLQISYEEYTRQIFITLHLATSLLWTFFYVFHHKSQT